MSTILINLLSSIIDEGNQKKYCIVFVKLHTFLKIVSDLFFKEPDAINIHTY